MTAAQRAIAISVIVAFLAGLAGIAVGHLLFVSERTPSLHEALHDELNLTATQDRQIETLERDFTTRRRALEAEMRAANGELAAAMREEHEYGPRVTAAVERFHRAMGELQGETMEHMFAMRAILSEEQRTRFDAIVAEALTDGRQ